MPYYLASFFCFLIIIISCNSTYNNPIPKPSSENWDLCMETNFQVEDFEIKLPTDKNAYQVYFRKEKSRATHLLTKERIFDQDSIPMVDMKGKLVYFPTNMVQYAMARMDKLVYENQDTAAIALVERIVNKMINMSYRVDSMLLIPYNFNFYMHGGTVEETMEAPWYSAMAQGQLLSLVVRLYKFTGNTKYVSIAQELFNSFKRIKGKGAKPWVSCIDSSQHIWFEEYPADLPSFTLNGKIFAIMGIYDFYRIRPSEEVGRYLKGGITTIKANIDRYRNEGDYSFYCIKHKHWGQAKIPPYHSIHIKQLEILYDFTGDKFFLEKAAQFTQDTPEELEEKYNDG